MRTKTATLIGAMSKLAQDIESVDGLANMMVAEAADRLEELDKRAQTFRDAIVSLLVDPQERELEPMYRAHCESENLTDDEKRKKAALCVLLTHPKDVQL